MAYVTLQQNERPLPEVYTVMFVIGCIVGKLEVIDRARPWGKQINYEMTLSFRSLGALDALFRHWQRATQLLIG